MCLRKVCSLHALDVSHNVKCPLGVGLQQSIQQQLALQITALAFWRLILGGAGIANPLR
jgi:hypothetical protein